MVRRGGIGAEIVDCGLVESRKRQMRGQGRIYAINVYRKKRKAIVSRSREKGSRSMQNFEVGDVVQLKSGGPRMTVVEVKPEGITCQWYSKEDEDYKSGIFAPDALKPYVSSRPRVGGDRGLRGY